MTLYAREADSRVRNSQDGLDCANVNTCVRAEDPVRGAHKTRNRREAVIQLVRGIVLAWGATHDPHGRDQERES